MKRAAVIEQLRATQEMLEKLLACWNPVNKTDLPLT